MTRTNHASRKTIPVVNADANRAVPHSPVHVEASHPGRVAGSMPGRRGVGTTQRPRIVTSSGWPNARDRQRRAPGHVRVRHGRSTRARREEHQRPRVVEATLPPDGDEPISRRGDRAERGVVDARDRSHLPTRHRPGDPDEGRRSVAAADADGNDALGAQRSSRSMSQKTPARAFAPRSSRRCSTRRRPGYRQNPTPTQPRSSVTVVEDRVCGPPNRPVPGRTPPSLHVCPSRDSQNLVLNPTSATIRPR